MHPFAAKRSLESNNHIFTDLESEIALGPWFHRLLAGDLGNQGCHVLKGLAVADAIAYSNIYRYLEIFGIR